MRDDLDRARAGRRRSVPSRKRSFGEHDVGQQHPVAGVDVDERPGDVGAGEQPGHADVAAEELVLDRQRAAPGCRPRSVERGQQRREDRLAVRAGEHRDRRRGRRRCARRAPASRRRSGAARGSPRPARRRPRRRTRRGSRRRRPPSPASAACTSASKTRAMPMPFSCCATLFVLVERRERTAGHEVVLVGREHEPATERGSVPRLPRVRSCRAPLRLRRACAARMSGSRLKPLTPSGTTPDGLEPREAVEDAEQRVVEHVAVVDARAHDDLAVHRRRPASSSAPSQRRLVAPRRLRSSRARTSGSVAWMLT